MTRTTRTTLLFAAAMALALGAGASTEASDAVEVSVEAAQPVLQADQPSRTYLKVGLTGRSGALEARAPVNLALVLDRSSSMAGSKIEEAKQAARLAVERLGPDDIVSLVAYDSGVEVLFPATKVGDGSEILARIRALQPNGSTALFAGVATGIAEVRKFMDDRHVNRVILLSDGQANIGPSSPNELAVLGASAGEEGISVTTIGLGLGYNEDLMARLARASDGNHAFVESADALARIFDLELEDVLNVVAREVSVKVRLPKGVRPVRLLNRDGEIHGQEVVVGLNQLYGGAERYFLLEVEVAPGRADTARRLASVDVSWADLESAATRRAQAAVSVRFAASPKAVAAHENRAVMVAAVEAQAVAINRQAVALRDEGKTKEAQRVLEDNATYLKQNATRYGSQRLESYAAENQEDAKNLAPQKWNKRRKSMRKTQHSLDSQQSY